MKTSIEVIDRATSNNINMIADGNLAISLNTPSVVLVHGSVADVDRYERTGNDLLIYMKDGSVIRCDGYFQVDETEHHSELVFQDDNSALTHISFADMPEVAPDQIVPLQAQIEMLDKVDPLLYGSDDSSGYGLLGLMGAGLGGALVGAVLNNDEDGGSNKVVTIDNTLPPETAPPTFIATDNQGQLQTLLVNGSKTDDLSPVFSGSGQAGANIQIVNVEGVVIASTQVGAGGTWTVTAPDQALGQHTYEVVQQSGGNSLSAGTVSFDIVGNTVELTIDPVGGDNQIDESEVSAALIVSGSATGLETGTEVIVSIADKSYTTQIIDGGLWSLELPSEVVAGLHDGFYTAQVSATDLAGNGHTASKGFSVDTSAPVVSINAVALDDVLNASEVSTTQTISGSVMGAAAGETVTVNVGGTQYQGLLGIDNTWSVDIPSSMWTTIGDGALTISASTVDAAGNTGEASRDISIAAGLPGLRVATVSGDDIINAIEHAQDLTIFGTSTGLVAGQTVTATIDGKSYLTAINADGSWQVGLQASDVSKYMQGLLVIHVSSADASGNPVAIEHQIMVDLADTAVSINAVALDNIINSVEQASDLLLSGATANVEAGQVVVINFAGHQYLATVAGDGGWSVVLPATDLGGLTDGYRNLEVQVTNSTGSVAHSEQLVQVDVTSPILVIGPAVSSGGLDSAHDDLLNALEVNQDLLVSGVTSAQVDQALTVSLNGQSYQTVVGGGGVWSVTIPSTNFSSAPDGALLITATTTDKAGNSVLQTRELTVDTTAPVITINTVAGDNVIDGTEQKAGQLISGTADTEPGQVVEVTFNGRTYQSVVADGGAWSVDVDARDFLDTPDGDYDITASVVDKAGNAGATNGSVYLQADAPTVTINSFTADDILSKLEQGAPQTLSGTSSVDAGRVVTVTLNGKDYSAPVQGDHSWSVVLGTADLAALADSGVYSITATATDNVGNTGSSDHSFTVDLSGPLMTLTIDSITVDSGPSSSDFITNDTSLAVQGTLGAELGAGELMQISLDGGATWINLHVSGTTWTYVDSRTLGDGTHDYTVRLIDSLGNVGATASQLVTIDTNAPTSTIAITSISDDTGSYVDYITNDTSLTVNGTLSSPLAVDELAQISLDNGATWTALSIAGTTWSHADDRTLVDGSYQYTVRVIDVAGSIGSTYTQTVIVDTAAPVAAIHIDSITDDTGVSATDYITSDNTLVVNGTLSAALNTDEIAQISLDGGAVWTALVTSGLAWNYTDGRTLSDGVHTYQVRVVDLAGNSGPVEQQAVTVDRVAPTTSISIDSISDDTGLSLTDFITRDTSLTLSGTLGKALESDELVQISIDAGTTWITLTDVTGTQWGYIDSRVLTDGNYDYQLRVIDQAGNIGQTASQTVVVDTIAPLEQATITGYDDDQGARQGIQTTHNITDDTAPVLQGTLTAELQGGEVLKIFQNGIYLGVATVSGGTWAYALTGLENANTYDYSAVVTDAAGNTTTSADYRLNVDTSVPSSVTFESQITSDTTPVLRGTILEDLSASQILYITVNGITYSSSTSYGDGRVVVDTANRTWYVQIPSSDNLGIDTYDVIAKVVNEDSNGSLSSETFSGAQVVIAEPAIDTQWAGDAPGERTNNQEGLSYSIGENGLWNIVANTAVYNSSDLNTYSTDVLAKESVTGNTVNYTYFDLDRDGDMDIFATQTSYTRPFQYWQNDNGSYTSKTIEYGALDTYYGGTVAYDRTGNGYLDLVLGDSNLDSYSSGWFNNNQDGTFTQDTVTRGLTPSYSFGASISGVDINNDGTVDITGQMNGGGGSNGYTLGVITNNGDGTMAIGQIVNNVFNDGGGADNVGTSMTWADFNGDGTLDLYLNQHFAGANKAAVLINNNGTLDNFVEVNAGPDVRSRIALAVDWDHNGTTDIAKMGGYNNGDTIQMILNNGNGLSWTNANLNYSYSSRLTGAAAMDYDWDGAVDLIGFTNNGHSFVVKNTNAVAEGTSMHLRIVDQNGINAFYGNTVQLFDSSGALVATQILNAQSGVGVNDSSALLNFYGLSASETYSVNLIRIVDGVRSDVTETVNSGWGGLTTGDATHNYVLSVESDSDRNNGVFVGSGYNDTFIATAGSDTYNGGGGWSYSSEHGTWVAANGGMDVVDYQLATNGVTVDLSSTATQDTGFNSAKLVDVEGVLGSSFDDIFTGSAGDNQFQGRGGNDLINIANGGHDSLIYNLLSAVDATGGNGTDAIAGFTVGTWEGTNDTDRIDINELLHSAGYTGTGSASYVDGVATLDTSAGNIEDYLSVLQNGANTDIQFDHDGLGGAFDPTTIASLSGVQVDLATLLANHQLLVA
ncbi:Ig-like domain-containing protein [Pseudomonas sp. M30-35]|uniref:Ig-like domain-containing protein n=1 Tax=Pseudomonas sp. M30-35 TaxID=1981174 RepID=UPI000B3C3D11|nr:Ig-like domain-containing protein [Pseudomonas sp. M30-35]ARU88412.1 hypothetical protein B9K09_10745 [Pseudomonas sp. M30-35]